ncbi:MAG TPA: LysR family transcriptional regulator, partial [Actinomycetes bacterium]
MTWSRLRSFVAVADTGSVRAAAVGLSVTESAVSAALSALQGELGAVLVERQGRGLRLTEAGVTYADYARQILGLLDEGAAAATQGTDPERGTLRLGAVTTAGEYLLPGLLSSYLGCHPGVEVTLEVGVRDRVHELLTTHQLDLVIGGRPPRGRGLVTRAMRRNSLVVVA